MKFIDIFLNFYFSSIAPVKILESGYLQKSPSRPFAIFFGTKAAQNVSNLEGEAISIVPEKERSDERILITQSQQGDPTAFEELVIKYQREVFAIALGMLGDYDDAKDVAQDAFVQAYKAIRAFQGKSKFSTWLISITINLCRHRRRWWGQRKKHIAGSLDEPIENEEGSMTRQIADTAPISSEKAIHTEERTQMIKALKALDKTSRTIIVLRDIQDLSYEEIAKVLHCRTGTVKSRLNRARLKLKSLVEEMV
jgi:RNA polymerase sigma-70 factor (ECF subfamily)